MIFSKRVDGLQESATLKINAIANQLKQEGKTIINLTAGEPDFPAFDEAKKAVIDALEKNMSKYTPTPGVPELRELVAKKTNAQQPALSSNPWKPANVMITNGGKQAIFNVILTLIEKGDEVLVPAPYWLSYPEMVKVAEGVTKTIPSTIEDHFKMSAHDLEKAISPKTKMLIINSPCNPTGATYSKAELQEFGKVLDRHPQVWVVSDEIYDRIDYTQEGWTSFLEACPQLRNRTITVNGMSKSGAMTGWRVGWSVSPENVTPKLNALQGHSTSGICSLSQMAAIATLKLPPERFEVQRKEYLNRRNLALEVLRKSAKIKVDEPHGAFYLFVDLSGVFTGNKTEQDANDFVQGLLKDEQVAVVSGVDFGAPKCVRLSFATDLQTLLTGCQKIVDYCEKF
jgi:aspartate aminotransferase